MFTCLYRRLPGLGRLRVMNVTRISVKVENVYLLCDENQNLKKKKKKKSRTRGTDNTLRGLSRLELSNLNRKCMKHERIVARKKYHNFSFIVFFMLSYLAEFLFTCIKLNHKKFFTQLYNFNKRPRGKITQHEVFAQDAWGERFLMNCCCWNRFWGLIHHLW